MWVDQGLNDRWVRPQPIKKAGPGRFTITLCEPLGRHWPREIVAYPWRRSMEPRRVSHQGRDVPFQRIGDVLSILVEDLAPGEQRVYELDGRGGARAAAGGDHGIRLIRSGARMVFTNGVIALALPASQRLTRSTQAVIPGPLLAIRRGEGPWLGGGRLAFRFAVRSVHTRRTERGPLWSTAEVVYTFEGGYTYRVCFLLRPNDAACEVRETSTLPVRLWPAPRPYREIGSLGKSFWRQSREAIAKPCLRPSPTSYFIFDLRGGWSADRMVTHSTGAWEIMDLPLGAESLRTYTAMRPALPFIDGGWMGVYDSRCPDLLGVASLDLAHWRVSDDMVHPAHRTPGANIEVLLVDSKAGGSQLRFPIENMSRRWLLTLVPRPARRAGQNRVPVGRPVRLEPDPAHPLWALRTQRGDLRLDKVKDWITTWPDAGAAHPRVLCRQSDFSELRQKLKSIPELRRNHARYRRWRAADRYIATGERSGLAAVDAATHARERLEQILAGGYTGPNYCHVFARPLRRYVLACDILWDCFTPREKQEARRVCALAAYILTDGDWWGYAWRPGETTYLPNFNSDVFTCAGLLGLFLANHPCAGEFVKFCTRRLELELKHHLRADGGGEENLGAYYFSTWTQLYLPIFWALRHTGVKDYAKHPCVRAGAQFMLKVLGPPDRRDHGGRMIPPIGHHPHVRKAFPVLDQLASFLKRSDPALAGNLKWAWRACGSPVGNLHDHFGPRANPLTRHYIFHDQTLIPREPKLGSCELPNVGAVLRSHDGSGRGSYVLLKAGRVHSHHDADEGSFHYFGRGVPLALDGLPIQNGAGAAEHNAVTFSKPGQPSGLVECFKTTAVADYVRARMAPRAFCCDSMYVDGAHRSGWQRELLLVKAERAGGVEYLVVKDTVTGPEACQWNLDVLSRRPIRQSGGGIWFPGHKELGMGLEVRFVEPNQPAIRLQRGVVNPAMLDARRRRRLSENHLHWSITEHWLMHVPAGPGATFVAVLFPRRAHEPPPRIEYLPREESLAIEHPEGRDLIFLRPNERVGANLDGVIFRGRAGISRTRNGRTIVQPLDAAKMARQGRSAVPVRLG